MMNSKYTQIKSLWKNKQILTEAAMDWKQSHGCFPSVGEFTAFINECLGEIILGENEIDTTREINENDISRYAKTLTVLVEGKIPVTARIIGGGLAGLLGYKLANDTPDDPNLPDEENAKAREARRAQYTGIAGLIGAAPLQALQVGSEIIGQIYGKSVAPRYGAKKTDEKTDKIPSAGEAAGEVAGVYYGGKAAAPVLNVVSKKLKLPQITPPSVGSATGFVAGQYVAPFVKEKLGIENPWVGLGTDIATMAGGSMLGDYAQRKATKAVQSGAEKIIGKAATSTVGKALGVLGPVGSVAAAAQTGWDVGRTAQELVSDIAGDQDLASKSAREATKELSFLDLAKETLGFGQAGRAAEQEAALQKAEKERLQRIAKNSKLIKEQVAGGVAKGAIHAGLEGGKAVVRSGLEKLIMSIRGAVEKGIKKTGVAEKGAEKTLPSVETTAPASETLPANVSKTPEQTIKDITTSSAKPAEAKPAEAKPAEAKPVETKPAEAKPAEAKPAEAKPAEAKPAKTEERAKREAEERARKEAEERARREAGEAKTGRAVKSGLLSGLASGIGNIFHPVQDNKLTLEPEFDTNFAPGERWGVKKRTATYDPFRRMFTTQPVYVSEGKLSPKESLQRKLKKQKYKISYLQDGKKVEVFASSIRGVRRVVYGKKQFRVHNSSGSDVTGYFKKLLSK